MTAFVLSTLSECSCEGEVCLQRYSVINKDKQTNKRNSNHRRKFIFSFLCKLYCGERVGYSVACEVPS